MCPNGAEEVETLAGEEQEEEQEVEQETPETEERPQTPFDKRREYLMKRLGAKAPVVSANEDETPESVAADEEPVNPLQYRPPNMRMH
ncbi:unnamed protein product, partial [Mesorhabditis spiculigera]